MKIKVTNIISPSYLDLQVNVVHEITYKKGNQTVTESLLVNKVEKKLHSCRVNSNDSQS